MSKLPNGRAVHDRPLSAPWLSATASGPESLVPIHAPSRSGTPSHGMDGTCHFEDGLVTLMRPVDAASAAGALG